MSRTPVSTGALNRTEPFTESELAGACHAALKAKFSAAPLLHTRSKRSARRSRSSSSPRGAARIIRASTRAVTT
jgi:hypothetical protein